MNQKNAYSALADWFEYLNDDCGYEEWSQVLSNRLVSLCPPPAVGLDVGCGGGYFTRALAKLGYQMTGMDLSNEMLAYAAQQGGRNVSYIQADVTSFRFPRKADFAVSLNDCFNYVPKEKLLSAFKNVFAALKKGGVFLFDVSSEKKLKEKVANQVSFDDRDEVTYLTNNTLSGESVLMDVTLFIKEEDGRYSRFDERHTLYIHREEEILSSLKKAGFAVLSVSGHLGEEKSSSDRLDFVCKK